MIKKVLTAILTIMLTMACIVPFINYNTYIIHADDYNENLTDEEMETITLAVLAKLKSDGSISSTDDEALKSEIREAIGKTIAAGIYTNKTIRVDFLWGLFKYDLNKQTEINFSRDFNKFVEFVYNRIKTENNLSPNNTTNIKKDNSYNWISPKNINIDGFSNQYLGNEQYGVYPYDEYTKRQVTWQTTDGYPFINNIYLNIGYGYLYGDSEHTQEIKINDYPLNKQTIYLYIYDLDVEAKRNQINIFLNETLTGERQVSSLNALAGTPTATYYFTQNSNSLSQTLTLLPNTNGYFYVVENIVSRGELLHTNMSMSGNFATITAGNNYTGYVLIYDSEQNQNIINNVTNWNAPFYLKNANYYLSHVNHIEINNETIMQRSMEDFNVTLNNINDNIFRFNQNVTLLTQQGFNSINQQLQYIIDNGNITNQYLDTLTNAVIDISQWNVGNNTNNILEQVEPDTINLYDTATEYKQIVNDIKNIENNITGNFETQVNSLDINNMSNIFNIQGLKNSMNWINLVHNNIIDNTQLGSILLFSLALGLAIYIIGRRGG